MLRLSLLQKLILELTKWPGIGPKSAERLAFHLLKTAESEVVEFAEVLKRIKQEIGFCHQCHNYAERDRLCYFCVHPGRDAGQLCVVEDPFAIERIESTRAYHGLYHVLHGSINLLMGITPDKLKLDSLQKRIELSLKGDGPRVTEVILALDSDLEGDTTAAYLTELLSAYPVRITRLAQGVPSGTGMGYIDERTLSLALQNRIEIGQKTSFHNK